MAPGLFAELPNDWASVGPSRQRLERLLSRADAVDEPAQGPARNLLTRFGYVLPPEVSIPEGPLALLGDGGNPGSDFWFCAAPVVLHPDRDQLVLFDLEENPPAKEVVSSITQEFNRHFEQQGWRLEALHPTRWYLRSPRSLDVRTTPVDEVVGRNVGPSQPAGPDSGMLRRLSAETEMLMHGLAGDSFAMGGAESAAPNGLWLHGGGQLPAAAPALIDALHADEPLALGLAALCGVDVVSGMDPVEDCRRILVYTERLDRARRRNDKTGYERAFNEILDPVCDLRERVDASLAIQVGDGGARSWRIDHRTRWRWWRRRKVFSRLAAT